MVGRKETRGFYLCLPYRVWLHQQDLELAPDLFPLSLISRALIDGDLETRHVSRQCSTGYA